MTYAEQLKSPKWQKKRLEILERDNFECQSCGCEDKQLHVHHKSYEYGKLAWEYDSINYISLCHYCHKDITKNLNDIKSHIASMFHDIDNTYYLERIILSVSKMTPDKLQETLNFVRK